MFSFLFQLLERHEGDIEHILPGAQSDTESHQHPGCLHIHLHHNGSQTIWRAVGVLSTHQ